MMKLGLALFLLFALSLVHANDNEVEFYKQASNNNGYDYLLLCTEWAGTVCKEQKCSYAQGINKNYFNIHGLWPTQNKNPMSPANCAQGSVQVNKYIQSGTKQDLTRCWSGLYSSMDSFHTHEWTKHGSCWNSQPNQIDSYFKLAISLANRYNAYAFLAQAGIYPGKSYPLKNMLQALANGYKVNGFTLECSNGNLKTVRACFDKNNRIISCPQGQKTSCPQMVGYPAL